MTRIFLIGIGYRPLDKRSREIIMNSGVILASSRLADVFARYDEYREVRDKVSVINSIDETMNFMKSSLQRDDNSAITLLASGDPMFFGIGRRVMEEFGQDTVEIIPDLSSMQLAFARIKEPWDDALLLSLHGGPDPRRRRRLEYGLQDIPFLLKGRNRISILTDRVNNPGVIAQTILDSCESAGLSVSGLRMYVCEKIGYPEEKVTEGSVSDIAAGNFSDPNVVIIKNSSGDRLPVFRFSALKASDPIFGLTEGEFAHSKGLITKDEVRAAAIHNLRLPANGVLWDIGAGSGSISIESALMCPGLRVFSIEKDDDQIANIMQNINNFHVPNMEAIKGSAPDVLLNLPSPDRVFIGGSGGRIGEIIRIIRNIMQHGVVVINAATLENFNVAVAVLRESEYSVEASQIAVSRMKPIGDGHFFAAQNPIFVITGRR